MHLCVCVFTFRKFQQFLIIVIIIITISVAAAAFTLRQPLLQAFEKNLLTKESTKKPTTTQSRTEVQMFPRP